MNILNKLILLIVLICLILIIFFLNLFWFFVIVSLYFLFSFFNNKVVLIFDGVNVVVIVWFLIWGDCIKRWKFKVFNFFCVVLVIWVCCLVVFERFFVFNKFSDFFNVNSKDIFGFEGVIG